MTTTQPEQLACFSCGAAADGDTCKQCGGMTGAVISQYTDHEALEDGALVAVTDRDRCTCALFEDMAELLPSDQPPQCWPIDLMTWCNGKQDGPTRAMSACKGLIGRESHAVRRADGDPVRFFYSVRNYEETKRGRPISVPHISNLIELRNGDTVAADETNGAKVLWLLPNELGGVTMMYPSDY